ncbi:MAG: helix-hairpin-helix domain-containing protein [Bacteroidales bacterium]|nr:helix-hairpin-helix domain-containing protein [Bacteroidales bacterium]
MKKTFTNFANFFAFTKGERRGIVALLSVISFLMFGIQVMPYYTKDNDLEFSDEIPVESSSNFETIAGDTIPVRAELAPVLADNRDKSEQGRPHFDRLNDRSPQQEPQPRFQVRERQPFRVHANTADTLDLQQIRGIGSATSHRIVQYRERLGGFVRVEQLLEVWGIDSERFEQIKEFFIIDKQNIRKLNINTISIRDLQRHPYLDYWQAKAIVQNRDENGFYANISDILKLALIDQETFDLIKDYLEL